MSLEGLECLYIVEPPGCKRGRKQNISHGVSRGGVLFGPRIYVIELFGSVLFGSYAPHLESFGECLIRFLTLLESLGECLILFLNIGYYFMLECLIRIVLTLS